MGFEHVFAGPLVRSSYHAAEALSSAQQNTEVLEPSPFEI